MGMDPISARYGVPGGSDNLLTVVMGTYSVRFDPVDASGDVIQVRAFNNSSLTSLGHGWFDGPNELPEVKGYLPLGSIRQDFSWFESMPYNGTRVPTMPSDR